MFQIKNHWMDSDEIWYGYYAIGLLESHTFLFPTIGNANMVGNTETCEVEATLAPFTRK
jgi:hypothetical protein